jgi:cell division protein ZapE
MCDNGTDYRTPYPGDGEACHCPLGSEADAEMAEAFTRLASGPDEDPILHIEAREITSKRRAGGVVWFSLQSLVWRSDALRTTIWKLPPSFILSFE